jgi:signal transduction histidine kinase
MLTNLLDNAIRHARHTVVATCERTSSWLVVRIADDGSGIAPADRERIFQRFVRVNSDYVGAGLGLAIAKWIAEAHGGSVSLASSGPAGTTFVVRLPNLDEASEPEKAGMDNVPAA